MQHGKTTSLFPSLIRCSKKWLDIDATVSWMGTQATIRYPLPQKMLRRLHSPARQRCMMSIFYDLNGKCLEVFMDDFTLFGGDFDDCLKNLELVLECCETTHLVLNWEKCHFMVKARILLGHKVTTHGIEVDRAKVDVISSLPPPTSVKSIRSFLGHDGFYRRFFKNFSSITKRLTTLLVKDVKFVLTVECLRAFELIKENLVSAPIMATPDWSQPFEIMCDASDVAVEAVPWKRKEKKRYLGPSTMQARR
ncbi:putative mitochondrial protein AtMg00860 [Nicotiana tabacum]|uniref:Mitochondrial protein AtMg00860 n=1 Tax=Nicotiana tabacum TaxID=4097 RepID=A0AC58TP68_TOBAC